MRERGDVVRERGDEEREKCEGGGGPTTHQDGDVKRACKRQRSEETREKSVGNHSTAARYCFLLSMISSWSNASFEIRCKRREKTEN